VSASSTMSSARGSDPCRGDAKNGTRNRRPRAQGATGARLSCTLFFPGTSSQMLLHTHSIASVRQQLAMFMCPPSLCPNRPQKISFLPDRRLSRAIDTSSAHAPAQSHRSRQVQMMELVINLLLQLQSSLAWQILMWPTPIDSLVHSSARLPAEALSPALPRATRQQNRYN
jgi:hypothetical protein